jgi:hypothetical protein
VTPGGGDYTLHVVLGIDHRNRMFLLDLWRKQADLREWVEMLVACLTYQFQVIACGAVAAVALTAGFLIAVMLHASSSASIWRYLGRNTN